MKQAALRRIPLPTLSDVPPGITPRSLRDWFDIQWFFPDGFTPIAVDEQDDFILVIGQELIYKFPREFDSLSSDIQNDYQEMIRSSWEAAVQELHDHQPHAEAVYLGIQPFIWSNGEPTWEPGFLTAGELLQNQAVPPETPFALVMKRFSSHQLLLPLLDSRNPDSINHTRRAARGLVSFHKSQLSTAPSSKVFCRNLRLRVRVAVDSFRVIARDLSAVQHELIDEIGAYLEGNLLQNEALFRARVQNGFVQDGHGALRAEKISVRKGNVAVARTICFGRAQAANPWRVDDVLRDVADVAVSLQVRGYSREALEFEQEYERKQPRSIERELLKFYSVVSAFEQAFDWGFDDSVDASVLEEYLAVAFKRRFCLFEPLVLLWRDGAEVRLEGSSSRAAQFAEVVRGECMTWGNGSGSGYARSGSNLDIHEEFLRRRMSLGSVVVVVCNKMLEDEFHWLCAQCARSRVELMQVIVGESGGVVSQKSFMNNLPSIYLSSDVGAAQFITSLGAEIARRRKMQ